MTAAAAAWPEAGHLAGHGQDDGDDQAAREAWRRQQVARRKDELRTDRAARAELAAEDAPGIPPSYSGAEFLGQPDDEPVFRIDGLWPSGGNVVVSAAYKAGKTTLVHNLIRCLCDGTPLLGRYHVTRPAGRLYVLDAEMPSRAARRWLADQQLANAGRFEYQNLRGAAASFNILVPAVRDTWARRIAAASASVVILDCLGPFLAAFGLDESSGADVGRFLSAFEQLLRDAGVAEAAVIHHMGHGAERARGASRLRDWPDAEWRLVRQDDNPGSPRYLSAFGRDVDVPESRLDFDPATRALRIAGGSRAAQKIQGAVADLVAAVRADPGIKSRALEAALTDNGGHTQKAVRDGIRAALREGLIIRKDGERRAKLHYPGPAAEDTAP